MDELERNCFMQYLLSLLPVLACPLGMGALMWLMMRGMKEPSRANASEISPRREGERSPAPLEQTVLPESAATSQPSLFKTIWDCVQMCLNWKVLVGLVLVAVLVGMLAPSLFAAAIPVLVVLVCPLSMGIMLLRMGKMRQGISSGGTNCAACLPAQENQADPMQPHQDFEQPLPERSRPPVSPHSEIASYE
jgi:hypothetical protein